MTARHTQRREFLLGALAGTVSIPAAAAQSGTHRPSPFWARLAGIWLGELSYLDGSLQPIIQSYQSVLELSLQDAQLAQTEYKFYPAGT
ncbi:MAG: hypothetical protein ACI87W_000649 [Halieaceae bacterium]|jgi:hypothetical protein